MVLNTGFDIVKKLALLVFVLLPLMHVQAQASDAAVNTGASDAAVNTVEATETSASGSLQRKFDFPRWPENRPVIRERVPLAPPGPYMSSALSGFSFKEPSFSRVGSKRASWMNSPDSSMEQFNPDIPWPSHAKSPARWQPENGYRYVEPLVKSRPYKAPQNYGYGYKRTPVVSEPDSRTEYNRPVMRNPAH